MQAKISQRIHKNAFAAILGQFISKVTFFFYLVLITRYLTLADYGKYGIILSVLGIFQTFAFMGFKYVIVRGVASKREKAPMYFGSVGLIWLLTASLAYIAIILWFKYLGYETELVVGAAMVGLSLWPDALFNLLRSLFQGFEKMKYNAVASLISGIVQILSLVVVIVFKLGLRGVFMAYVFSRILSALFFFFLYVRFLKHIRISKFVQINWDSLKGPLIKEAFYFAIIEILAVIFLNVDIIMLSKMSTYKIVAVYRATFKIVQLGYLLIQGYAMAVYPAFSNLLYHSHKDNNELLDRVSYTTLRFIAITVLLVVMIGISFNRQILLILYGSKYLGGSHIFPVLLLSLVPVSVTQIISRLLFAFKMESKAIAILVYITVLNIFLNAVLIPIYGMRGAALATTFSKTVEPFMYLILIKEITNIGMISKFVQKISFSVGAFIIALLLVPQQDAIFRILPIFVLVVFLYFLKVVDTSYFLELRDLLKTLERK